jgi:hypothetical protein
VESLNNFPPLHLLQNQPRGEKRTKKTKTKTKRQDTSTRESEPRKVAIINHYQ